MFRDQTNTPFNNGDIISAGAGPHILDLGNDEDRALGVHLQNTTNSAAIQFLANIGDLDANALSLTFDVEAWDRLAVDEGLDPTTASQVGFRVSAEFDFGNGFESAIDFGEVLLSDLVDPTDALLDGNLDTNRAEFTLRGGAPFAEAQQLRLLFEADETTTSPGWVFGLDDVELEFDFLGDFDGDNQLTLNDVNLLGAAIRHSGLERFDLTGDGLVDADDIEFWVLDLFGTSLGDANLDNTVDFSDFLRFAQNFGSEELVVWQDGDFDADGAVGFSDFLAFSRAFGITGTSQSAAQAASVPEPNALLLGIFSLGVVGLLTRRRR